MSDLGYLLVCPLAYLLSGGGKFVINSVAARRLAFDQIGLGRLPSTHTAIVSAPTWLIALREGINTPALGVAIGVVLIVVIDAMDLRRKIEQVNTILKRELADSPAARNLRDSVGHSPLEIAAGIAVGGMAAAFVAALAG
jgi:uncharacterized protein